MKAQTRTENIKANKTQFKDSITKTCFRSWRKLVLCDRRSSSRGTSSLTTTCVHQSLRPSHFCISEWHWNGPHGTSGIWKKAVQEQVFTWKAHTPGASGGDGQSSELRNFKQFWAFLLMSVWQKNFFLNRPTHRVLPNILNTCETFSGSFRFKKLILDISCSQIQRWHPLPLKPNPDAGNTWGKRSDQADPLPGPRGCHPSRVRANRSSGWVGPFLNQVRNVKKR